MSAEPIEPVDPLNAVPTEFKKPTGARIVAKSTIYYQEESQPIAFERGHSESLISNEQPYVRKHKATEEWKPLELAWLNGMELKALMVTNDEGRFAVNPTPEERVEVMQKEVLIGLLVGETGKRTQHDPPPTVVPFLRVTVGDTAIFQPIPGSKLMIKSKSGTTTTLLVAIPR